MLLGTWPTDIVLDALLHPMVVWHFGRSIDIGFTKPPQDATESVSLLSNFVYSLNQIELIQIVKGKLAIWVIIDRPEVIE